MQVRITSVRPEYPTGYYVQWTVDAPPRDTPLTFLLERSGGPEGPWVAVLPEAADQYGVRDNLEPGAATERYLRPNQYNFYHKVYYRVSCFAGTQVSRHTFEAGNAGTSRVLQGVRAKLRRDFELQMKLVGMPVVIVKRRRWGKRCRVCFDVKTARVTLSDCVTCWGTTFEGGFWTPTSVHGRRSATPSTTVNTSEQKSDGNKLQFWLPQSPQLERDDLLIQPVDNRRFLIDRQLQTEIQLDGVHQTVIAQELARDHVLYRYEWNFDLSSNTQ